MQGRVEAGMCRAGMRQGCAGQDECRDVQGRDECRDMQG